MAQILICDYCKQQVDDVTQIQINGSEFDFCQECAEALINKLQESGEQVAEKPPSTQPPAPQPVPENEAPISEEPPKPAPKRKPGRPKGSGKKKVSKKTQQKKIDETDPVSVNVTDHINLNQSDAGVRRELMRLARENPNAFNNLCEFSADIGSREVKEKMAANFKKHRSDLDKQFNNGGGVRVNIKGDNTPRYAED